LSLNFLAEHADAARIALDLAEREAKHLRYTWQTLYAEPIDLAWVESLPDREELAEKIDALVGRFGRLQDHLGEKLLPSFAKLLGGQPKSLIDVLNFAERMGWITNSDAFVGARRLRNLLVYEYMNDASLFLDALLAAKPATEMLFGILQNLRQEALSREFIRSE
jgi:hypothetical protein